MRRKASIRRFRLSRLATALCAVAVAIVVSRMALAQRGAVVSGVVTAAGFGADLVVSDIGRPMQLAFDRGGRLVVLSHGRRGDAAGEVHRFDVTRPLPIDAERAPHVVIPFAEAPRKMTLGSLALDPRTGDLYLGEENGNRVYRLSTESRLTPVAIGLQHLVGGSSIALDGDGRLIALDYVSPETEGRAETPPPRGLEAFGSGYQGPLIFRVALGDGAALPRRLDLVPPLFPRGWLSPPGELLTRFISVASRPDGTLLLLDSLGQVFRLGQADGLTRVARLPAGHYQRTSIALTPDGALLVSTGLHLRRVFRVTPDGAVATIASELGDAGGVAMDAGGRVYVAETALHRVIRIVPK